MAISEELLEILACPICYHCKLLYEIKDDIPIMLIDEAKPLDG